MDLSEKSGTGTDVVALAADLMFGSRIRGAAQQAGATVQLVSSAAALQARVAETRPRLVLLDLDARGVDAPALLRELAADPATAGVPVLCFVSHVNAEAIAAARAAGADRVMARSAFVRELPGLLRAARG